MEYADFKIIDIEKGEGRTKDRICWVCITTNGQKFNVLEKVGTNEYCTKIYNDREKYIYKTLNVKFQGYSTGIPRFSIANDFFD